MSGHVVSTYSRSLLSRGIDVQQISLVTWYRRTAGLSCHVVSTYSRSLLSRGIDVQQVSLVTWYRRTAGLSCHVVSTYSRSLLSRGIDVQQVSLVTWYRRTAGLLSSTMTCQTTGSCISTGERDVCRMCLCLSSHIVFCLYVYVTDGIHMSGHTQLLTTAVIVP